MPIRKIAAQVTVVRKGVRAVVPPNTPFNFTAEELESINKTDKNLVRKATEAEVKGASKFEELPGQRRVSQAAVPVNTQAVETAPTSQPSVDTRDASEQTYNDDELEAMTVAQLKDLAKEREIDIPSNANKAELKKLILDEQGEAEDL